MPSKSRTSKTSTKNIRFSHAMLEQIEHVMKAQKTRNFSAWVKEACREKIKLHNVFSNE
ncbi:DUF3950 domain-containing protein [Salmonella enterica]|uniref:DUF3950 domain-containing protein n=1 Tax=Salmonella enterica subsp. diarizonae serovar 48:i:z TaxID=1192842 RepID=A0A7U5YJ23_SALDZ|nr:YlcI/YnfO family protein [Salmonella enterica]EAA4453298.1 DUF3950 domain-containing protein [Salmonella enterica subsp. diarizonae]EDW6116922.1 DUF3950 domain-containing protein [Salmonella enterica subsp. salamae]AXC73854.1 DUF3950 domain-containing protein [Salmonella enterica subsp. diarizonae serovar 48:i:z]EAM6404587.1 DUF3950 domain-containing protein [Salmonella enterica]EAN2411035.1 DUF3950 domain-containing protein [Salmonella enterica]